MCRWPSVFFRPAPGLAPPRVDFFSVVFSIVQIIVYLYIEKPKGGRGFPLPLESNPDFESELKLPNLQ